MSSNLSINDSSNTFYLEENVYKIKQSYRQIIRDLHHSFHFNTIQINYASLNNLTSLLNYEENKDIYNIVYSCVINDSLVKERINMIYINFLNSSYLLYKKIKEIDTENTNFVFFPIHYIANFTISMNTRYNYYHYIISFFIEITKNIDIFFCDFDETFFNQVQQLQTKNYIFTVYLYYDDYSNNLPDEIIEQIKLITMNNDLCQFNFVIILPIILLNEQEFQHSFDESFNKTFKNSFPNYSNNIISIIIPDGSLFLNHKKILYNYKLSKELKTLKYGIVKSNETTNTCFSSILVNNPTFFKLNYFLKETVEKSVKEVNLQTILLTLFNL